jgi:hypothetical protein
LDSAICHPNISLQSLKYLLDQWLPTIPQQAWVNKLFGYQFIVEFKMGHQNAVTDAPSHRDEDAMMVHTQSLPKFDLFDKLWQEAAALLEIVVKHVEIAVSMAGLA